MDLNSCVPLSRFYKVSGLAAENDENNTSMTKQKILKEITRIFSVLIFVIMVGPGVKGLSPRARISLPMYEL